MFRNSTCNLLLEWKMMQKKNHFRYLIVFNGKSRREVMTSVVYKHVNRKPDKP